MPLSWIFSEKTKDLPVTVRISPRARRVALRLDPAKRTVQLIVPRRMSLARAMDFARAHEDWIHKSLNALPDLIPFEVGVTIPVLGVQRVIGISPEAKSGLQSKGRGILLEEGKIILCGMRGEPQARIRRFLIRLAQETLENLVREKLPVIGKTVKKIGVRDTRSRWGSCSVDGVLSFSWRLIFAPPEAMDYVVAHEVAHLVHMDHSKAFWKLCADLSTDFSTGRRWMRLHGQSLMRYG